MEERVVTTSFLKCAASCYVKTQNKPVPLTKAVEGLSRYNIGDFRLDFVSISRVINHMNCYKFECSHWLKLQHSDRRANPHQLKFNLYRRNKDQFQL